MKLLKKILITSAALAALSSTLAYADDMTVLIPNGHGSYSAIYRVPNDSVMVGLSVNGSGGCSMACGATCMDRAHGSSAVLKGTAVTFRDNAHGQQVPR